MCSGSSWSHRMHQTFFRFFSCLFRGIRFYKNINLCGKCDGVYSGKRLIGRIQKKFVCVV